MLLQWNYAFLALTAQYVFELSTRRYWVNGCYVFIRKTRRKWVMGCNHQIILIYAGTVLDYTLSFSGGRGPSHKDLAHLGFRLFWWAPQRAITTIIEGFRRIYALLGKKSLVQRHIYWTPGQNDTTNRIMIYCKILWPQSHSLDSVSYYELWLKLRICGIKMFNPF